MKPSVFEIFEYRPYKRNAKEININIAKKITINFKKLLFMNQTYTHKLNINKELSSIRLDKVLVKKLELIVDRLESGDIGLEESVKLYEEGMKIKKICDKKLKDIEMQIKKIKIEDNKVVKENF